MKIIIFCTSFLKTKEAIRICDVLKCKTLVDVDEKPHMQPSIQYCDAPTRSTLSCSTAQPQSNNDQPTTMTYSPHFLITNDSGLNNTLDSSTIIWPLSQHTVLCMCCTATDLTPTPQHRQPTNCSINQNERHHITWSIANQLMRSILSSMLWKKRKGCRCAEQDTLQFYTADTTASMLHPGLQQT